MTKSGFGWTSSLTMLRYGSEKFAKQRCMAFNPVQIREARTLVRNLYASQPAQYESYLSRFATGIITQVVAGHTIASSDDPYLRMSSMVLESLSRAGASPGGTAIDFFPFLQHFPRWFPGTHYAGVAIQWRPTETGQAKPSFLLEQLEEMETWDSVTDEDQEDLKGNASTRFTAGETTTWSTLSVFVLAMVLNPECQLRAREEIDSVIGTARLPEFGDRGNLPYVEAIVQETFRWNPGVPFGLPHRSMEDDTYRGLFIPAGSLVLANIRGMTLDETIYSNPTNFHPDRFLPKPLGGGEPPFPGKFGFGRRVCTGQYLAENSVWIAIATILATCKIINAVDEHGEIIDPENEMSYGLTSHPKDFRCVIIPRNAQVEALVAGALEF
ncbi:cytochrome P450 [Mycena vulgaris]|nr:cytochrome P450 [Mycena vulgaris]